jgi:HEAT repeat protein
MRVFRDGSRLGQAVLAAAFVSFFLMVFGLAQPVMAGGPAPEPAAAAEQVPFEAAIAALSSPQAEDRLKAVTMLKAAAYPEAAVPLAALVLDPQDAIQLEAIGAELNIFLAKKVVPKKKVGLVVEVRTKIEAEPSFTAGPLVLGAAHVPNEVLTALRTASRDDNPRVGVEALYAFGTLASEPGGTARRELQRASAVELAALVGASDFTLRAAAIRVIGRLFDAYSADGTAAVTVGDAVITSLNDRNRLIKLASMDTLGAMRYGRAVDALTQLWEYYGQGEFAEAAFDALARIANPASLTLFTSQLSGKSPAIKAMAIEALARMGDSSQLTAIEAALIGERSDRVIFAGTFASAMLGSGSLERITDSLLRGKQREVSKQYLADIARGRADRLGRYAQDPDPGIRADVADVLGFSGDAAAQPIVESMIKDENQQVALAAERAALRLRAEAPVDR